ncbi:glutamate-5-semialdehyde dehydrogenase [Halanaeroarchaeum sulfurireducens]|uniref:Gamma-glutamyl phosphate reductase n=1 Tax=Halanaeroarchaeum sulfurireducens TaxID=1604004 RepID=A0A0F7PE25_9EURY|nr:glutamate-5-semialdehyde dehydrogenase [Halanaeroarchaeum sulfurireducens]AKH97869.1 gamma-glutamyl phosphate reductase [Halanaeroarchaeum sulfurireducens]
MTDTDTVTKVEDAQIAALELAQTTNEQRSEALRSLADALDDNRSAILEANARDVDEAETMLEQGEYSQVLVDRLKLDDDKIDTIIEMVRSVADQDDPLGETLEARKLDDGLELYKVSVPIGVVGSVFESRPDALVQIASLSLKSGNAAILKGGSEALHSNRVLYDIIREATADLVEGWVHLVEAHEAVDAVLEMDEAIDLLMPRGSTEFVRYIQDNTKIPVLGHTEGVCHVYVDVAADREMATDVAYDAKVQYPAVCNAAETLLVHEEIASEFLPAIAEEYEAAGVEMRGDERTRSILDVDEATQTDWQTEYGDLIISIKVVDSLPDAVDHVNSYGSKHTETIVTDNAENADVFMQGVDAASVFHNASTRFADGYRYGLGAEVGISTGKIHARGPVGLDGLTTDKYYLEGDGQRVASYAGPDATQFTHEPIEGDWDPGRLSDE